MADATTHGKDSRTQIALLASGMGALTLGIGLGILVARLLGGLWWPFLVAGGILHGWGMIDSHRLRASQGLKDPWWSRALYWFCWTLLAALAIYVFVRISNS